MNDQINIGDMVATCEPEFGPAAIGFIKRAFLMEGEQRFEVELFGGWSGRDIGVENAIEWKTYYKMHKEAVR